MEAVLETQAQLQSLFLKKMDEFQAALQDPSSTGDKSALATQFSEFRVFVLQAIKGLQDQINLLAKQADTQEMRSRRKMLLVHGLAEEKGEDVAACVVKVLTSHLKLTEFSAANISRCQRIGRLSNADKPRPILFKLRDLSLRQKIWLGKTALKGSGVTLSEFLTKPRHDAFMAARQRFGITKCWTRDGVVVVLGPDGTRHTITNTGELNNIAASESATATPVKAKKVAKTSSKDPKPKRKPTVK